MKMTSIKQEISINTATVLAEAFGDQVFIKNLKMEMEKDLNTK